MWLIGGERLQSKLASPHPWSRFVGHLWYLHATVCLLSMDTQKDDMCYVESGYVLKIY